MRIKSQHQRWFFLCLVGCVILGILAVKSILYFQSKELTLWDILSFGVSAFTASFFYFLGAIVWRYTIHQSNTIFFFGFCGAMACVFATETSATINIEGFSLIASFGSVVALFFLACFFRAFPSTSLPGSLLYTAAILVSTGIAILAQGIYIFTNDLISRTIFLVLLVALILLIIARLSYVWRYYHVKQETQQIRKITWVFSGFIVATIFWAVTTLVPQSMNLPSLPGEISTLPMAFFPLALAIAILRYQLLVLTSYIRNSILYLVRILGFALICYFGFILENVIHGTHAQKTLIAIIFCFGGAMAVWWGTRPLIDVLFFQDLRKYRMGRQPEATTGETKDIVEDLIQACMQRLSILHSQIRCYVLDPTQASYRIVSDEPPEQNSFQQKIEHHFHQFANAREIPISHPWMPQLATQRRPAFLHELLGNETGSGILQRYLVQPEKEQDKELLLVPMLFEKHLIGLLILDEREEGLSYAGEDFFALQMLLERFVPAIEHSRVVARANSYSLLLSDLSSASILSGKDGSVDQLAQNYVLSIARSISGHAAIYRREGSQLLLMAEAGSAPKILTLNKMTIMHEDDGKPYFFELQEKESAPLPSLIARDTINTSFAWLPLRPGASEGLLLLSYGGPHIFSEDERHILLLFADQCGQRFEQFHVQDDLQQAIEYLKNLDKPRDAFMHRAVDELQPEVTKMEQALQLLKTAQSHMNSNARSTLIRQVQESSDGLTEMLDTLLTVQPVDLMGNCPNG
ncbi:hypothetical protein [Dictyobacter kobayashii]|uniref:GAF domain-containing protein n=1 Tax=Dictyobacter kobayashii TaxID=2014872 RepID=A0A402AZD8_9CHLR|nr:hypothetical protein [Dictyobacter kobayashii]GCE24448.1 hypothetical protein KDK_82480 [Dictyobacter kobayashii]